MNNLGVALLSQGKLKEVRLCPFYADHVRDAHSTLIPPSRLVTQGIEILEGALTQNPFEIVTTEPFLFNICKSPSHAAYPQFPLFLSVFPPFPVQLGDVVN